MSGIPTAVLLVVTVAFTLLSLLGVALFVVVNGPRARLRRRMQQVVGIRPKDAGDLGAEGSSARRKTLSAKLREVDAARQKRRGYKLREELNQAGLALSVRQFLAASGLAAFLAAALAYVIGLPLLAVLAFAVVAGIGLPKLVLRVRINRRIAKFTSHFADAIDIIVRGIRSGLPIAECLGMIAHEAPDPVGSEFRLVVEGQRLGLTLEEALEKAVERVPTAELRFFAIVLAIQRATGGNLADTLAKLSDVLRGRKRMRDKIKAMSGEAKASAGIIGSLPILVGALLAFVSPDYVGLLFKTSAGHLVLLAGGAMMVMGVLVMRRMINFEI